MLQEFVDGTANVEDEPRSPYSLSKEEADEITARFIKLKAEEKIEKKADNFFTKILDVASHKGSGGFDFYRVSGASEVASAARSLERRVFEARFGNDAVEMDREYGPYDPQSDFFIAIDKEKNSLAGVVRIIKNGEVLPKTFNDIQERIEPPEIRKSHRDIMNYHGIETLDDCWDISTAAVSEEYKGTGIGIMLYRLLYKSARKEKIKHLVTAIDAGPKEKVVERNGIPLKILANMPKFEYLGSPETYAMYGYVPELFQRMIGGLVLTKDGRRRLFSSMARRLVFGSADRHTHQ